MERTLASSLDHLHRSQFQGIKIQVHISYLKAAPPDIRPVQILKISKSIGQEEKSLTLRQTASS